MTMVGVGTPNQFKPHVKSGTVAAVALWDPKVSGYVMCKIAELILEGREITDGMDLGIDGYNSVTLQDQNGTSVVVGSAYLLVTRENIDEYDF